MLPEKEILNIDSADTNEVSECEGLGTPEYETQDVAENFRVFKTQEDFQACLDRALGKRLAKQREQTQELARLKPLAELACSRLGISSLEELEELENAPTQNTDKEETSMSAESLHSELSRLAEQNGEAYNPEQCDSLLADEKFNLLIKNGFSVKEAYDALNLSLLINAAQEKAKEELLREIRLKGIRPTEDAVSGYGSFSAALDPQNLSDAQRKDIRERVRRGERITF